MTAKTDGIRTSKSHPITVSVVMSCCGRLSLCYCPGKNVVRDGVKWQRDLQVITDYYLGGNALRGVISPSTDGLGIILMVHCVPQEDLNRLRTVHAIDTIGKEPAFTGNTANNEFSVMKMYWPSLPPV